MKRLGLISALVTTPLLAVPTIGHAQSYLGLSPAGEQTYKRVYGPDSDHFIELANDSALINRQIREELARPTPSWQRLRPLIRTYETKREEMRVEASRLTQRLLEQLSDEDRIKVLKQEYGPTLPPTVVAPLTPSK